MRVEPHDIPQPKEMISFSLLPSGNLQCRLANGEVLEILRRDQVPPGIEGVTTEEAIDLLVPDRNGPLPIGLMFRRRVVGDAGARRVIFAADN